MVDDCANSLDLFTHYNHLNSWTKIHMCSCYNLIPIIMRQRLLQVAFPHLKKNLKYKMGRVGVGSALKQVLSLQEQFINAAGAFTA